MGNFLINRPFVFYWSKLKNAKRITKGKNCTLTL